MHLINFTEGDIRQFLESGDFDCENPFMRSHISIASKSQMALWQWLNEPCYKHLIEGNPTLDAPDGMHYPVHRYLCHECLKEIRKTVGG